MARREALVIESNRERFKFYYDQEYSTILHITLRHGTTPEDAIRTFFEGETSYWDESHSRFVTLAPTHGIYWARHAFDQSVIVISCFKQGDE